MGIELQPWLLTNQRMDDAQQWQPGRSARHHCYSNGKAPVLQQFFDFWFLEALTHWNNNGWRATCQAVTAVHHPSVDLSATKVAGSIPHQATLFLLRNSNKAVEGG